MKLIVEGLETEEDQQKFTDNFTIALFEMYVDRLEKNQNIKRSVSVEN